MELLLLQLGENDLLVVRLDFIFHDPSRRINGFIHKCRHGNTSCVLAAFSALLCLKLDYAVSIIGR